MWARRKEVSHFWKTKKSYLPSWQSRKSHQCRQSEGVYPGFYAPLPKSPLTPTRTCFFVLGLISSTSQGAEILDDYNWEATLSPLGMPTGLCIPADVEAFTAVRDSLLSLYVTETNDVPAQIPPWTPTVSDRRAGRLIPPTAEAEIEVITAIQNLANTVIANAASRSLARYVPPLTPLLRRALTPRPAG